MLFTESQHSWGGKGPAEPTQPDPYSSRVPQRRLHRAASRRVVNVPREGDATAFPGSLSQRSITLRVKRFFLIFSWNFPWCSLCPLSLVLSPGTTEKNLAPSYLKR